MRYCCKKGVIRMKYHYFETLEQLCDSVVTVVSMACGEKAADPKTVCELRRRCDRQICELEDALFSDFLPPLERENIAACAHCLSRVIDRAADLASSIVSMPSSSRADEEQKICIRLCEVLHDDIALLKEIRKPSEMPSHRAFRALLAKGRSAHADALAKIGAGALPRSYANSIILCAKLRSELARSYDELLEIMLNNI